MNSNTVDTSAERIGAEWAMIRAEAAKVQSAPTAPELQEQGNTYSDGTERPEIGMGTEGFDVPEIPTGQLCCFAGAVLVDRFAPGWRQAGLTDEHVESVGQPLGLVIDKYLDKYFPGQKLGEMMEPWKEELALGFAVVNILATVDLTSRHLREDAPEPAEAAQEAA